MAHTLPAARAAVPFSQQPRVMLMTSPDREQALMLRRQFAAALVRLGIAGGYGVFLQRAPRAGWGIYLGRHDGGPVEPDASTAPLHHLIRRQQRIRLARSRQS
jgi:hypothetical protein